VLLIGAFVWTRLPQNKPPPPACRVVAFEGDPFTVCEADLDTMELRLVLDDSAGVKLRNFATLQGALGERAQRVVFATNAGMFDDDGRPIGLYVEAGRERRPLNRRPGPGNFHMLPNGVFSVDRAGVARIETSAVYEASTGDVWWATQSGPMLVINGALHPRFQADGASRYVRNGVGLRDGKHVVFAISETPVSFGKFARLFRDALGCSNALYLDGSVSGLWAPHIGRQDGGPPLGPFFVILRKADLPAERGKD
jgi:uncharacterized protein YigE (DUF2233 family)